MKILLYLDDCRSIEVPDDYRLVIVRDFLAFCNYITIEGLPDVISFDHDLADEHIDDPYSDENWMLPEAQFRIQYDKYTEKTGYDAAKWLVDYAMENELPMPKTYVHSHNLVGGKNILTYINNYIKHAKEDSKNRCEFKYSYGIATVY